MDDRSYRDIRLKTADGADDTGSRADNPDRTMLGKTQLKWLEQTLLDAQTNGTPWKIVALSSPIDETSDDGGKSWAGGYRAERNELLKFIADNHIDNVVFLSTDDHQNRVNELDYLADPSNPSSRTRVPNAFTIVAGPIGAGGPDAITDHSFSNIQKLTDDLVTKEKAKGLDPLGLDPTNPRVHNVFREFDPNADKSRSPVDFYSPDTFNYVTLNISADGKTLSVDSYGINSYAANTFPEPNAANSTRHILGFQIDAASTLPNGVAAGDTTQTSTVLWTHSTVPGQVTFDYSTDPTFSNAQTVTTTETDTAQPVKVQIDGLQPGTDYYYRATNTVGESATGKLHTSAALGTHPGLTFGISGDWRGELSPYPSISNAASSNLQFFLEFGDTIYADYPSPAVPVAQATTLQQFRDKHDEVYRDRDGLNTFRNLRSSTSILATIDDHEVTDNFAGGALPRLIRAFKTPLPVS